MSKTPAQVLYEYCQKKKTNPDYRLIRDETGTHQPTFIIRCEAFAKFAIGEAGTKKEARQKAAENLLDILKITEEGEAEKETINATENTHINQLDVYCSNQGHLRPQYEVVEEKGQDHDKLFVVKCTVSGLHEIAEAKQKKRARHLSAFQMLKRLKTSDESRCTRTAIEAAISSTENTNQTSSNTEPTNDTTINVETANEASSSSKSLNFKEKEVFEKYAEVTKKSDFKPAPLYKNDHLALVEIHKKSLTLKKLIDKEIEYDNESAAKLLATVAKELGVDKELKTFKTNEDSKPNLCLYKLRTDPEVSGLGYDENAAAFNLLNTLTVVGF